MSVDVLTSSREQLSGQRLSGKQCKAVQSMWHRAVTYAQ